MSLDQKFEKLQQQFIDLLKDSNKQDKEIKKLTTKLNKNEDILRKYLSNFVKHSEAEYQKEQIEGIRKVMARSAYNLTTPAEAEESMDKWKQREIMLNEMNLQELLKEYHDYLLVEWKKNYNESISVNIENYILKNFGRIDDFIHSLIEFSKELKEKSIDRCILVDMMDTMINNYMETEEQEN